MKDHFNLSDQDFLDQFISCDLQPGLFTHEAHLRLAFLLIKSEGEKRAADSIQKHIKNYVAFYGAKDKYNCTLTIAAAKTVAHFMRKSNAVNFNEFIKEFPQLINSFKELLACHYSFDLFNNSAAKEAYLEPDLIPFH